MAKFFECEPYYAAFLCVHEKGAHLGFFWGGSHTFHDSAKGIYHAVEAYRGVVMGDSS